MANTCPKCAETQAKVERLLDILREINGQLQSDVADADLRDRLIAIMIAHRLTGAFDI